MNSWEIIKNQFMEGRPNTIRRHIEVNKAASIFVALGETSLKDWDKSVITFNADKEVEQALINKRFIEGIIK